MIKRLRDAVRNVFGKRAPALRGNEDQPNFVAFSGYRTPPRVGTKELLESYSEMPWLRAVVDKVSGAVGVTQWRLYITRDNNGNVRRDSVLQAAATKHIRSQLIHARKAHRNGTLFDVEEISTHPLLELLQRGNDVMLGDVVLKVTQQHIDLTGDAFWIIERNGLGVPVAVWPVPPHWVHDLPTKSDPVYKIKPDKRAEALEVPATEVIRFYDPDPADPYGRGTGISRSLGDELETDEFAAKHVKSFFFNSARPDLIIYGEKLNREDTRRLEERWLEKHSGFWNAFKPHFINRKIEVKEIGQSFEEMQLTQLRKHERDTIIQVFGVPPEKFGVLTACYDEQTECLTRRGFVRYTELTYNDEIATVNLGTGKIEYHRPTEIMVYDYDGVMHHWHGQHSDVLVTPNHRMVVYDGTRAVIAYSENLGSFADFLMLDGDTVSETTTEAVRTPIQYTGKVWCVTVPNGVFVTRRNGKTGIHGNSNRSTITAADMFWTKDIVLPRIDRIRNVLQARLVPMFDARLVLDFESPVVEDKELQLEVMRTMPGAFTKNEWREAANLPSLGEAGEIFIMRPGEIMLPMQGAVDDIPMIINPLQPGGNMQPAAQENPADDNSDAKNVYLEELTDKLLAEILQEMSGKGNSSDSENGS